MQKNPLRRSDIFRAPVPGYPCDVLQALQTIAVTQQWHRGDAIYHCDEPVRYWYRIVAGMARKSMLLSDGRRRIVDFLLPGDCFGFSWRARRFLDVEAVVDTTATCYPWQRVELLADSNPEVARWLRLKAFESISRLETRLLVLGRVTAVKKVSGFLMEMAERSASSDGIVALQMSRYDIADYLTMSVETVSRALTDLQHHNAIILLGKHNVKILDPVSLSDGGRETTISGKCD